MKTSLSSITPAVNFSIEASMSRDTETISEKTFREN